MSYNDMLDKVLEKGLKVVDKLVDKADEWVDEIDMESSTDNISVSINKETNRWVIKCPHCDKQILIRVKDEAKDEM